MPDDEELVDAIHPVFAEIGTSPDSGADLSDSPTGDYEEDT
jgi:hypothetical protein